MKRTVLFVTELCPWPIRGGEIIRSYNLIDGLCQDFRVIVMAPRPDNDCELLQKVYAWVDIKGMASKIQGHKFKVIPYPPIIRKLRSVCRRYIPDLTWFDYGHWGQYAQIVRSCGSRTIMGTHNRQSSLRRQQLYLIRGKLNYFKEWVRYQLELFNELYLFRFFDRIVSVSNADLAYHARFVGQGNSVLLPNFVNEAWYKKNNDTVRKNNLVMITGNFGAYQNKIGTQWFLTDIWPWVRRKVQDARLELVGKDSKIFYRASACAGGVRSLGEVDCIASYLQRASVGAVPILQGSGSRLKILEALACGVPVVSTTLGAEGIKLVSGESCILEDSAHRFAKAIVDLLENPDMRYRLAENGFRVLKKDYGFLVNVNRIRKFVEETIKCSRSFANL